MIQNQTFEGFPIFGDNSTKSQPEAAIYSNGFAPADVLPAEYYNWLTYKASKGITDLNKGVVSMEVELNNVVSAGGQEPSENTNNQIITAIRYLINQAKAEAILAAHPVGSLYWSSKDTNPSTLFGGTWTQIKDKFVLAAGDTYSNGATGGTATVTLTTQQIPSHTHTGPSHTHSFTPSGTVTSTFKGTTQTTSDMSGSTSSWWRMAGNKNGADCGGRITKSEFSSNNGSYWTNHNIIKYNMDLSHTHSFTPSGTVTSTFKGIAGTTEASGTDATGSAGGGTAHNNMPPYVVKYCWERTA